MNFHQFGFYLASHYSRNPVLAAFTLQDELHSDRTFGTKYQQRPNKPRAVPGSRLFAYADVWSLVRLKLGKLLNG